MRFYLLVAATAMLAGGCAANASILAAATGGQSRFGPVGGQDYVGQSFTVAGAGSFDDVTLSLFSYPTSTPYAVGTGYLFSKAYFGSPALLSSGSADLLGTATSANGTYNFSPSVVLTAGTQYFFYEDAEVPGGTLTGDNPYLGGNAYYASGIESTYTTTDVFNFEVSGQLVSSATPEPSSFALLGTGLLGVARVVRKRFAYRQSA